MTAFLLYPMAVYELAARALTHTIRILTKKDHTS